MMMAVMVNIYLREICSLWVSFCCLFFNYFPFAVVLFQSREHENCGPQPGFVRAHIESKFQFI